MIKRIPYRNSFLLGEEFDSDLYSKILGFVLDLKIRRQRVGYFLIDSTGGDLPILLALIDLLKSEPDIKWVTIVIGAAYSCGFDFFLAGDERYALAGTDFLAHEGFAGHDPNAVLEKGGTHDYLLEVLFKHLKKVTKLKDKKIRDMFFGNDQFYSPVELKKLKLVDNIINIQYY